MSELGGAAPDAAAALPEAAAVGGAAPAPPKPPLSQSSALFDIGRLRTCIDHANEITATNEAKGEAEAATIRAKGEADAEELRAAGSKKAADLLASSETAVRFALIDKTGHALDGNKAFFFGADPGDVGAMLAQPLAAAASSVAMRDAPAPARRS